MTQPRQIQFVRGNTQCVNHYVGPIGSFAINLDDWSIHIQDGVTPGGHIVSGGGSNYSNANVQAYGLVFDGDFRPTGNNVHSLGSITNQWKDLFLSNSTVYFDGVPLTVDSNKNLNVNGNVITTVDLGNFTFDADRLYDINGFTLENSDSTHGYTSRLSIPVNGGGDAELVNFYGNVYLTTGFTNTITKTWIFDRLGHLSLPDNGVIHSDGEINLTSNYTTNLTGSTAYLYAINPDNANQYSGIDLELGTGVSVEVDDNTGNVKLWRFQSDAGLQFPDTTVQYTAFTPGNIASLSIVGDLAVYGNIYHAGNVFQISANNLIVNDNIIYFANANPANLLDIGIMGSFTEGSEYQHTGLIRDASDNTWRLFSNVVAEPGFTVDFTDAVYDNLVLGNITSPTIIQLQNDITAANLGMLGYVDSIDANLKIYAWNANLTGLASETYVTNAIANIVIPQGYGNTNVAAYLATYNYITNTSLTWANISGTPANVSYFVNDAGYITTANLAGYALDSSLSNYAWNANIPAPYGNANVAAYLLTNNYLTSADVNLSIYAWNANLATYAWNANLSSYATLTDVANANVAMKGYVDSQISSIGGSSNYGNANVATYLPTYSGNVNANYYTGNGALLSGLTLTYSLGDVDIVNPHHLDVLGYNSFTGLWEAIPQTGGNANAGGISLTSLSVAYGAPTNGGNLTYNDVSGIFTFYGADLSPYALNANLSSYALNSSLSTYAWNANVTNYSNVNVAAYLATNSYLTSTSANLANYAWNANVTNYSNVNVAAYLATNSYLTSTSANLSLYAWNANVTAANVGMLGYVNSQVTAANVAWQANALAQQQTIGNIIASAYSNVNLSVYTGNIVATVNGYSIGYRDIPQVSFTSNTTITTSDAGKHYYSTVTSNPLTLTIANNASQSFNIGAAINIINQGTGNITLTPGGGVTLYLAGNSVTGSRTLTSYGMATITKVATDTWWAVGVGLA